METTNFELYLRARHVFEEALRVLKFREVCLAGGGAVFSLGPFCDNQITLSALDDAADRHIAHQPFNHQATKNPSSRPSVN